MSKEPEPEIPEDLGTTELPEVPEDFQPEPFWVEGVDQGYLL